MGRRYLNIEIGAYLRDTQGMGALHSGGYLHLLMHYTVHGSVPHTDDEAMRLIARMTPQQWRRAKPVFARFFDAQWRNPRVDRNIAKQERIALIRTFAGQKGGRNSGVNRRARARSVDM